MTWEDALGVEGAEPDPGTGRSRVVAGRPVDVRKYAPPATARSSGPSGWQDALGTDQEVPVHRRRRRRRVRSRRADRGKRLDIQGLRAVAVVAVVVNHLTGHPQGGFLGVDVFFVISGYLITSLLLREGRATGSISLLDFYKRRVRRLFPAALTVTIATVISAHFVFLSGRAHSTLVDGIWATLFAANWREIRLGTNYFQSFGPVSPLQHYWSLSVEEQFYVLWPMTLLVAFLVCRRLFQGRAHAIVATGTIGALLLTVPSMIYAAYEARFSSVIVYFSTFSRAWELGLGATLAVLQPFMRGNRVVLSVLSWLGLVLIGVSLFTVTAAHVPFPGAILPCVGSGLCLIAWTPRTNAANIILTNPVASYIGDISYSIYLVHFPVIVFAAALLSQRPGLYYLGVCLFVLGVSMLLYHGIENPIRQSNWLRPGRKLRAADRRPYLSLGLTLGSAATVAALLVYALVLQPDNEVNPYAGLTLQTQAAAGTSSGPVAPGVTEGPALAQLQAQLAQALAQNSWPDIQPPFDQPQYPDLRGCSTSWQPAANCTWGNPAAHHLIYLVGDSTSVAYFNAWAGVVAKEPDWKFRLASGEGCAFMQMTPAQQAKAPACVSRLSNTVDEINQAHPDLVVITGAAGYPAFTRAETTELDLIRSATSKILVLPSRPVTPNPVECDSAVSHPKDCVVAVPSEYRSWLSNDQRMAAAVGGVYIDPTLWYCTAGYCPAFVGTTPMTRDGEHITSNYATLIAPVLLESLQELNVMP